MIILDTNVISELMKDNPCKKVQEYINDQILENVYLTSVNVAEILQGIKLLPNSNKKDFLNRSFNDFFNLFVGRVLPFDLKASIYYSDLVSNAKVKGFSFCVADAAIASIVLSNNFAIVTRDEKPFKFAGLEVINPWNPQ